MTEFLITLLKNPIVRIIGAACIIYYALFTNTYEKDSLGNRLSKETIGKNIQDAKERGLFVAMYLQKADEYKKIEDAVKRRVEEKIPDQAVKSSSNLVDSRLIIKDVSAGGGDEVKCGDQIMASYIVYDNSGNKIEEISNYQIEISDDSEKSIIKENLLGLKNGGKRLVIVPGNYKTDDVKTNEYMVLKQDIGINYEINLVNISSEKRNENAKCSWNNNVINADFLPTK
jgi:hypothetical protein